MPKHLMRGCVCEYCRANRERARAWRLANPEQKAAEVRRRRARIRGAEGDHTAEEFQLLVETFNYRCAYCSTDINAKAEADHAVPLSRGGSNGIENILPACRKCNARKGSKTALEYLLRNPRVEITIEPLTPESPNHV